MPLQPRPWISEVAPYQPGRPAPTGDGSLASNESPVAPSPAVLAAVASAAASGHRYPDPLADELRQALAEFHHVAPEEILVGNGSDELIFLLAWAFAAQAGTVVCAEPPYQIDAVSTRIVNATLTTVPLRDWVHDLPAMATVPADIAYLVNPHNPTGTLCSREDVAGFLSTTRSSLVVVDEAYIDFSDDPERNTAIPLINAGDIAVLRTFSKLFGLAGFRIGYLVANAELILALRRVRAPFSVGRVAQSAALASVRHRAEYSALRETIVSRRAALSRLFERAGFSVVPSQANFVLVRVGNETQLVDHFFEHGVAVRPGSALDIPGTIRVTVPTEAGLQLMADALRSAPEPSPSHRQSTLTSGSD